jgi:hypothetical protein
MFFFCFVVDIYVSFASASSNLVVPSYNSPRSTRECRELLCTFHAFCHYTPVLPNILLAEEVGQCHRAGVRPHARQKISHILGPPILNRFIGSCENATSLCIMMEHAARGRTPAVNYNISPRRGQWTLSNDFSHVQPGLLK